jgi:hypothetical protein
MLRVALAAAAALISALGPLSAVADQQDAKARHLDILGWVEFVEFTDPSIRLKAKLDTGATTSSLNALNQKRFKRDGESWIRFDVEDPENPENHVTFEAPIVRHVRIVRHGGETQRRPVVELGMCVGNVYRKRQFSLIDRTEFIYQVLIGRNFLRDHVAVDSGSTYLDEPRCKQLKRAVEAD